MGDDKNKSSLLSISGVIIILAALGVTIFTPPFKGSRPFVPELRESYQRVNARLWQDPFRAVLDAVKGGKDPKNNGQFDIHPKDRKGEWRRFESWESHTGENQRIIVLGVMVPGAPYAEDMEVRMRYRYAVLSGLSRLEFIPEDSEHIGFVKLETSENITLSNIMPFEWLMHTKKEKVSVLVLWINDNLFENSPLLYLSRLAEYLQLRKVGNQSHVKFRIIGPATSDTLKEMVREVSDGDSPKKLEVLQGTQIYSAMATVNNTLLHKDNFDGDLTEEKAKEKIVDKFGACGITFKRTIESDNKLTEKLVDELKHRRIHLKGEKEKPHILLVAEWDTYYGRSFHDAFKAALIKSGVAPIEIAQQVHRISYMRGIDGSLPGEKEEKKDEKAEAKSDPLKDTRNIEQPIGKSQYDYLRRLAEETYRLDQDLKANRKGEIKAIGIMGTDFYDKYLVLQALRQQFPKVIFFTTDLDARFLHPDNIKWTRNLVVASNFGFSLRKDPDVDIQGEIPPFRDNYQTSIFLTVLQAFSPKAFPWTEKELELIRQPLQPLIFEIGRHQAVALTDRSDVTIHPRKHRVGGDIKFYIKIAAIIISVFVFLFFTSGRVNNYLRRFACAKMGYKVMTVIGVLLIIFFGLAIYLISNQPDEEPFSIFEGISVWPTEIFRFIAIMLSVLFLYLSWRSRKENKKEIEGKFFENGEMANNSSRSNVSKTGIWNWIKKVAELDWKPAAGKQEVMLESLWAEYVKHDSGRYHVWRVIIISAFYFLFCFLIVSFDWPVSPVRGRITFYVDKILVMVSVISFVALLSFVFEVTRCCRKFIVAASNECSKKSDDQADEAILDQSIRDKIIRDKINDQLAFVRLIAMRTDTVGKLIFYPFIVWFVMFISRFDYFDNWRTPLGLAVVISLGALYAWTCAFLLRQSAESARTCVADHLKDLLFLTLKDEKPNPDRIKQIESVLGEVRSIRQGAFAPFTQHPIVQSLLVPFGGVGGIYLIEFLIK